MLLEAVDKDQIDSTANLLQKIFRLLLLFVHTTCYFKPSVQYQISPPAASIFIDSTDSYGLCSIHRIDCFVGRLDLI